MSKSFDPQPAQPRGWAGLEPRPGTYALILQAEMPCAIRIGHLGDLAIQPGIFIYVGSAFGPGGLRARVGRHIAGARRLRWHIDYLRAALPLRGVWYTYDPQPREHHWAEVLAGASQASCPMKGFGASDRKGQTHLFHFPNWPSRRWFVYRLRGRWRGHAPVYGTSVSTNTDLGSITA